MMRKMELEGLMSKHCRMANPKKAVSAEILSIVK